MEQEFLVVDAETLLPVPRGDAAVESLEADAAGAFEVTVEFKREQIEVAAPPQKTFQAQIEAVRRGRELVDRAAAAVEARAAALPVVPGRHGSTLSGGERNRAIGRAFGLTAVQQLTCGLHVHVAVASSAEGVAALDRVRIWLPAFLALSANSPVWDGVDTGYASYRYQLWSRWPTAGPPPVFGSAAAYEAHRRRLLDSGVPLDEGMLYFDARLSHHAPTLEFRVADISLSSERTVVIAGLMRALVESAVRDWRSGRPVPEVDTEVLRVWMWRASRFGVDGDLVDPATGLPASATAVVGRLLSHVRPILSEWGDAAAVEAGIAEIMGGGSDAALQRSALCGEADATGLVRAALARSRPPAPSSD